jgi:hypothetical protein
MVVVSAGRGWVSTALADDMVLVEIADYGLAGTTLADDIERESTSMVAVTAD